MIAKAGSRGKGRAWVWALVMMTAWLGAVPAALAQQPLLEVTGFKLEASPQPVAGERARVEFSLRNVSGQTLKLGSRLGVFLAAKIEATGPLQPVRRNFGKQLTGGELAPGQTFHFSDTLVWDMDGTWTLIPGCQLEDEIVYFEQQGGSVAVGTKGAGASASAPQPSGQAIAPAKQPTPTAPQAAPDRAAPAAPAQASPPKAAPAPAPMPAPAPPASAPPQRQYTLADCRGDGVCVKVLSYNIDSTTAGRDKAGWEELTRILARERPDLLVTPETVATDVPLIARAAGLTNFQGVKAYGSEDWRARVGVYSRWPMKIRLVALPVSGGEKERHFGIAEVEVAGLPLAFYGIHLSREGLVDSRMKGMVKEFLGLGRRQEEMETVVKELKADRHRFKLLAGDLNTYPMSGPYRLLEGALSDAFPGSAPGTYRLDKMRAGDKSKVEKSALEVLPNPKIDHVFHSQGLSPVEARVIAEGPSDHYPITATLHINPGDGQVEPARVKAVQEVLIKSGLLNGPASGKIDPATRRAVAQAQARKGATVDGTLSQETLRMFGL